MEMKGEYRVPLGQLAVWQALNDPDVLKASVPGCEELTRESDTSFKARLFASVGPVKARFTGEATLSDIDPPNAYTLTGSGSGGAAGMAKGSAKVRLRSEDGETILSYEVTAQVAGKLAQIGSRLVDMAAKKMADEFFGNFVRAATAAGAPAEAAPEPAGTAAPVAAPAVDVPAPQPAAEPSPRTQGPRDLSSQTRRLRLGWVVAALAAVVVIAILMARSH